MEMQELRELKQYVLDNFQNTKDKNLKKILRHIDKLIKKKIIQNNYSMMGSCCKPICKQIISKRKAPMKGQGVIVKKWSVW